MTNVLVLGLYTVETDDNDLKRFKANFTFIDDCKYTIQPSLSSRKLIGDSPPSGFIAMHTLLQMNLALWDEQMIS